MSELSVATAAPLGGGKGVVTRSQSNRRQQDGKASARRRSVSMRRKQGGTNSADRRRQESLLNSGYETQSFDSKFGGTFGCLFAMVVSILSCFFLIMLCASSTSCLRYGSVLEYMHHLSSATPSRVEDYVRLEAFAILFCWLGFLMGLYWLLPGEVVEGPVVKGVINTDMSNSGRKYEKKDSDEEEEKSEDLPQEVTEKRLRYRMNGHLQFWVTLLILLYGCPKFRRDGSFSGMGSFPLERIFDCFLPLFVASVILSTTFSVLLYIYSFRDFVVLSPCGSRGGCIEQFFLGRELNPRLCGFLDYKVFLDLRVGVLSWTAVNVAACMYQHKQFGGVSASLVALTVTQGFYCWDALLNEKSILTTMDISTDGLGFMLTFGNISFVPVMYTVTARYAMLANPQLSPLTMGVVLGVLLFIAGKRDFHKH
eukprot:GHVQ01027246.1.p1 GENE.GHVQ01027246.1~~GHVQ01027246.1.p1  ORF type:complete len:425 (-),score=43.62 GHVQ01027246.1:218-1492(-)